MRVQNALEAEDLYDKYRLIEIIEHEGYGYLRRNVPNIGEVAEAEIFRWLGLSRFEFPEHSAVVAKRLRIARARNLLEQEGFALAE